MVKKVSSEKNLASHVTGWRSLVIKVLQIFINGLQSMQKLVEKTAPRITNTDISVKDIQASINKQVTIKKDEVVAEVTELVTEIADQSPANLVNLTSEIATNIDAQINSIQPEVSANSSENLFENLFENSSDIEEPDLITEVTEKVEVVADKVTNTVNNTVKKSIDSVQSAKQPKTTIWHDLIYKIRSFMPKSWQAKLSDSMMTGLVTTILVTILTVSIVIGATLIPITQPSIALGQTDQNMALDNNNLQVIDNNDQVSDISDSISDITLDSDQSNMSERVSNSNLTENSDIPAIQPESNTQVALIDEVAEDNLTNNLTNNLTSNLNNNSELSEVNETPINQEKSNTVDDLVANNIVDQVSENTEVTLNSDQGKVDEQSLNTEIKVENNQLDTPDDQLDNQSSQTNDDIAPVDTAITNETIKNNANIESIEPANNQLNNLTDSLPSEEKSNNEPIKNENIAAPVKQIIPTDLATEADLPVEKTQVEPPPVKFTPEQYLVISIKNQIADITNRYGGGMVDSIQVNFLSGLLVIQVTDDWYDLDKTAQNQLANNLLKQAQDLDFTKLQIADTTGKLVARSPVVGEQMIILARSQSGIN